MKTSSFQFSGWNTTRRYNGYTLPSARYISLQFVSTRRVSEDETFTHMVMQWGQFMDHDMDFAPMAASNARYYWNQLNSLEP